MSALGIGSAEDRYRLLLEISRIVTAPLELHDVVDAIVKALSPFSEVDILSLIAVEEGRISSRSLHVRGVERKDGDTFHDILQRAFQFKDMPIEKDHSKPLAGSNLEHAANMGRPYVINRLSDENAQFDIDRKILKFGGKAYVLCPMTVRGTLVGALGFCRLHQDYFDDEEVSLFEDVSRIVATALANALAFDKIRDLRDQLQMENTFLREQIAESELGEMIGISSALKSVIASIDRVAGTDATVLICGETGTGKELVARAIHQRSPRSRKDLVKVNCAAIPSSLMASELFGHERGAFTGATQRRAGRFEMAAGGSLFLDEIGEIPPDVQVALLRVLQEREFERLGGTQTLKTDARMIAATNRDLNAAVADGSFRSDLFYRLNVFPIRVPPLRERREDVPALVESFLAYFSSRMGRKVRTVASETMDRLVRYDWPGNIRELQNVVERAVILADDGVLRLDAHALAAPAPAPPPVESSNGSVLRQKERETIERALEESHGRVSGPNGAATRLHLPASTLESRIRALAINKHRFKSQMAALARSFGA